MAQNIIFPDGPLFMVDRGWKNPHKDSAIQVVSFNGKKKAQLPRERNPQNDPAIAIPKEPSTEGAAFPDAPESTGSTHMPISVSAQNFQFVNVAGSFRDRDPELRKLVRSHVMKGSRRNQKPRRKPVQESTALSTKAEELPVAHSRAKPETEAEISSELVPVLPGSATSFYGVLPCLMEPHYYGLLNYYVAGVAHNLYPLESHLSFNPVKTSWFPLAITDELLLHTVLFSSAVTLSYMSEHRQSVEASNIMKPIFRLLASRLEDQSKISDATIGAVSCLALVENMFGNYAKWKVHATGLGDMVRTRGGISTIDPGLQMKICRADIEGAVDSVSAPQLPPITRSHPPIYSMIQPTKSHLRNNDLLHILASSEVSPELRTTLLDLSRFSQAMDYAFSRSGVSLDPKAFDEDIISIQHELLRIPDIAEREIAIACRLGALIYVKTLTREAPFSALSSRVVVQKLKSSLTRIAEEPRAAPLLLWLYSMGGIASQGLPARSWFTNKLLEFVLLPGELLTWMSVKEALRKILWIEMIHEGPCKQLWDETEITRAMSIGQD